MRYWNRFPCSKNIEIERKIEVESITLDTFADTIEDKHIDFIKIDIEGSESDALMNAEQMLKNKSVLGIKTELWWDPIQKGQKSFAELDIFLRTQGFRLFDLEWHNYHCYMRSYLPSGRLAAELGDDGESIINFRMMERPRYGQALTGDALYLRDPIADEIEGTSHLNIDSATLLRLAAIFDIFDYSDCAIELLYHYRTMLDPALPFGDLINALTPTVSINNGSHSCTIPYLQHFEISSSLRTQNNLALFKISDWQAPQF
jgi:hypothetical protein